MLRKFLVFSISLLLFTIGLFLIGSKQLVSPAQAAICAGVGPRCQEGSVLECKTPSGITGCKPDIDPGCVCTEIPANDWRNPCWVSLYPNVCAAGCPPGSTQIDSGNCHWESTTTCGNGSCETGETCSSCPADCTSGCGGTCSGTCFGGIANCGAVGYDPASGSCSSGQICCQPKGTYVSACSWAVGELDYPTCHMGDSGYCKCAEQGICNAGEGGCCTTCATGLTGSSCTCPCSPTCGTLNCGQANGCGGNCPSTDSGVPACPIITPANGGSVTISGSSVTVSWTASAKADRYKVEVYPVGTSCASPYAFCPVSQTTRTFTFNPTGGNQYTVRIAPINTSCGTQQGPWCQSDFTINGIITAQFLLDNSAAAVEVAGNCQLSGATLINPGSGSSITAQGQTSTYPGVISGSTATFTVPYWPPVANYVLNLTPGEYAPSQPYICTCPSDCNYSGIASPQSGIKFFLAAVDLTHSAWYQVVGGNIQAYQTSGTALLDPIPTATCTTEDGCTPAMAANDLTDTENSAGIAITGGGNIDSSDSQGTTTGYVTERSTQAFAIGTATKARENYDYFYRLYSMGDNPAASDDFAASASDAHKPSGDPLGNKRAFFHNGDLTIQNAWSVASNEKIVIFVHGNLNIADPAGIGNLIDVSPGGFLSFIVSGNITIANSVGNTDLTSLNSNIDGVYIADGSFTVESLGAAGGGDKRFVGEGTFVGWGGVDLNRDYTDGSLRKAENNTKPTETFIFRPDFVQNLPERMAKPVYVWQETN